MSKLNQKHSAANIVAPTQEEMPLGSPKEESPHFESLHSTDAPEVILEAFEGPLTYCFI